MTLLELVVNYENSGASQEQMQIGGYAERRINGMTNYEFLELLSEVLEAEEAELKGEA
ncbi:hypothetical protein D3C86_1858290 [compost metagenome]